jgi:hypothetical protein
MVSLTLAAGEFGEVELPASALNHSLDAVSDGGRVTVDVQDSPDHGLSWRTPIAGARLVPGIKATLKLRIPEGVRQIRCLLHNHAATGSANVSLDLAAAVVPSEA